jgi:urea transport system permease protein
MVCERARHARGLIVWTVWCSMLSCLWTASASTAAAQSVEALAAQLGSDDRTTMQSAIIALGTQQAPQALTLLEALEAGDLRISADGRALLRQKGGALRAVFGGATVQVASAGKLVEPAVTNSVRRVLKNALSTQRLRSPSALVRKEAATVLAESQSPDATTALRAALAKERDEGARDFMELALAQVDLASPDAKKRLAAVHILARVGEPSHARILAPLVARDAAGKHLEHDSAVREAAGSTLASFERTAFLFRVLRDFLYGVSLGSVLLLAALGLAITFGVMGVINMAHGEMIMLGAYSAYVAQLLCARYAPSFADSYLVLAVPLAFVVCLLTGVLIERVVIRHLYGRPLETLLATWGISLVLIQIVRIVFGAQNVTVANPPLLSGGVTLMPDVVLPYSRVATIVFASAIVLMVFFVLAKTSVGLQVRAITQNRRMARCVGIRTSRVDMLTFGLGSAVAGLGGVALSQLGNVGPELGQGYIVDSFMVVVVGGVGNVLGTVISALGLGVVNKLLEPLAGAVLGKIILLGFIILFIQSRPQGLFALKGRAAES